MTTASNLQQQLENVFVGKPWYGTAISEIITQGNWQQAFQKPPGSVHCIADIILHMTGWTEEVISRLKGNPASDPARGDWPEAGEPTEQNWHHLVIDLDEANSNLIKTMQAFPGDEWEKLVNDQRALNEPITTCEELVLGFIQHQIYHAGQIALLNRINHVN